MVCDARIPIAFLLFSFDSSLLCLRLGLLTARPGSIGRFSFLHGRIKHWISDLANGFIGCRTISEH